MKTIVLYESKSGSTQRYAEDIAKAIHAEAMPLKKFKFKQVDEFDTIVFGGWVRGGVIRGVDEFLANWEKMKEKNVIIFAVGMSVPNPDTRAQLISSNLLDMYHLRFYMVQGKFDFNKLNPIEKMLIKTSISRMKNDPNFDDAQKAALDMVLTTPVTIYDNANVDKIVRVLNKISVEVPQA